MDRKSVVLRDGRRVVHVVGSNTQTVNICTNEGRAGDYEVTYRLPVVEEIQPADIADLDDVAALEEWLLDHGAVPEHRQGASGARLWPLVSNAVSAPWMTAATDAVERVLDAVVQDFLDKPYLHRVEHSLHAELYRRLKEEKALQGECLLQTGEAAQLVHKEWPETRPDLTPGSSGKRGAFDLAVLAPELILNAHLAQYRQGRLAPPVVIEVGLDYGLWHLEQDAEKLLNSRVEAPYLLHLSRLPVADARQREVEEFVKELRAPLRVAYVHHNPRSHTTTYKRVSDPAPVER